ncbi:MAG: type II toxin-antitoxin system VapB family antitoxin [Pseudomonadales bacterium]|nr:type II toxin-antitoxin system VapB family antitoxin [Pseudomonadales bacterium]
MKTTIELPDALLAQARRFADSHDMTMKALIEQSLRKVMAEKKPEPKFKLRDGSFHGGNGLTPEFQNADWKKIRDAIYEGHGA